MTLKINSKAPNFDAPSTSNDKYSLKNSIGKLGARISLTKFTYFILENSLLNF